MEQTVAKGISTGLEHLIQKQASVKASDQLSKQWKELRNRIDVILMSNQTTKDTEARLRCHALDQMSTRSRSLADKLNA